MSFLPSWLRWPEKPPAAPKKLHFEGLDYTLVQTPRRSVALLVRGAGEVEVRAPKRVTREQIEQFLAAKRGWIEHRQQALQAARALARKRTLVSGETFPWLGNEYPLQCVDRQAVPLRFEAGCFWLRRDCEAGGLDAFKQFYRAQGLELLRPKVAEYVHLLRVSMPAVRVMELRGHWGSCSTRGSINFNWRLLMAPIAVIDYVVAHECAHLRHHSHAPIFWQTVAQIYPDYPTQRDWLKRYGASLTLG